MKLIPLSQNGKNKGRYFAQVDDDDFDLISLNKWHILKTRNIAYAATSKNKLMHRVIMKLNKNKILCDHKDGNGLNNQKTNLRTASYSQNGANRIKSHSSSNYLGVRFLFVNRKYKYWHSRIDVKGKAISLGTFPFTEKGKILGAIAYNNAAKKYFGEFATLNKINADAKR